ncbi:endonuclease/exonuclease/phosphatase family protein [Winogradskyella psychrotolerans]|uniref:endonuclease/exonuclease/phosphatase family protein n=1 Tax=Winogradskyella psychrotolerans TaxID=1344585 RepID=UPI00209092DB|nr:endonuclease/exonuclease/phosphatase family protein [Winogradskyella psychrotolerans]
MKKLLFISLCFTLISFSKTTSKLISSDKNSLKLITWNIQDLGQTKNAEEIAFIVDVLKDFDIVAIQEVVAKHPAGAQKVAQIADELNRKGAKWDYRISDPTKSPSVYMSERYAYLWKTSKIDIQGRAYLDKELAEEIVREPYIAEFKEKSTGYKFHVVNFHSRKHDDNPELEIIHFKNYQERLNTDKLLIVGDFNLNEKHEVWNNLYVQGFKSAVINQKTTLKRKCGYGSYRSHAIDNIYYSKQVKAVNTGVVDYIQNCENLAPARRISDHLPVFIEFNIESNNND